MKRSKKPQIEMLQKQTLAYGGELLKKRKNRKHGRTLDTKHTMHLVLRSTKAVGKWSFNSAKNEGKIRQIVQKFSIRYSVKVISMANVGNHLHLHIRLIKRFTYKPFIRAITAAIAMAVTGASRWNPMRTSQASTDENGLKIKFWDYRPFTRIVQNYRAFLNLKDYIKINEYEGYGYHREHARMIVLEGTLKNSS